jgi:hypothetical protein
MRALRAVRPAIGLGLCCLLRAQTTPQPAEQKVPASNKVQASDRVQVSNVSSKVQISGTERSDFPSGGMLHLKNSIGELTIEGWDQPGLEITTVKSSKTAVEGQERDKAVKLLDSVKIATERKGDEVTISTDFPKHRKFARPFEGLTDFDLDYIIKVPRNARLTVDHQIGEVHIDGVLGEIHATDHMGLISVRLPDGQYAIDALSKIGAVNSDFPGSEKTRKLFGQTFVGSSSTAPQRISLRIGYGDIVIERMHQPPSPAPAVLPVK